MRIRKRGLPPLPCVPSTFPPKLCPCSSTSHHRTPRPLQAFQPRSHLPTDDDARFVFFDVPTAHGAVIEQCHSNMCSSSSTQEDHRGGIDFQCLANSTSRLGPGLHSAHDATKQVDIDVGVGDVHVLASPSIVATVNHLGIMNSGTNSHYPSGSGSGLVLSRHTHHAIGSSNSSLLASLGTSAGLLPLVEQEKSSCWSTHQHESQQMDMIGTYHKTFQNDVNGQGLTHSNAIDYLRPAVSAAAVDLSYQYIRDLDLKQPVESESRIRCGRTSGSGWQCKNMRSTIRKTIYCDYHFDKVSIARLHAAQGRKRNRKNSKKRKQEEEEEMQKQRIVNVDIEEMVDVNVVEITEQMEIGKDCTNKVSLVSMDMGEQQIIGHVDKQQQLQDVLRQGSTSLMTVLRRVLQVARLAAEHRKLVTREVGNMESSIINAMEDEACLEIVPFDRHVEQQPIHESIPNLLEEAARSPPANYTKARARRSCRRRGVLQRQEEEEEEKEGFMELEGTQLHVYEGGGAAEDYRTDDVEQAAPTMVVDSNNKNNIKLRDVALQQLQSIGGSWASTLATADQVATCSRNAIITGALGRSAGLGSSGCERSHRQRRQGSWLALVKERNRSSTTTKGTEFEVEKVEVDHEEKEEEMRCSRMDGRGWRCKRRRSAVGTSNFCEHHRRTTAKWKPAGGTSYNHNHKNKKKKKKKKAGTDKKVEVLVKQAWTRKQQPAPDKKRKKQEGGEEEERQQLLPRTRLLQDLQHDA